MNNEELLFDTILEAVKKVDGNIKSSYNKEITRVQDYEHIQFRNVGQIILEERIQNIYGFDEESKRKDKELKGKEFSRFKQIVDHLRKKGIENAAGGDLIEDENKNALPYRDWNLKAIHLVYQIQVGNRYVLDRIGEKQKRMIFKKSELSLELQLFDRVLIGFAEETRPL